MTISREDLVGTEYTMLEVNFQGTEDRVKKAIYEFRPWLNRNFKVKASENTETTYTALFEFQPYFFERLKEIKDLQPEVLISVEGFDYLYRLFGVYIFNGQLHDSEPQNSFGIYEDDNEYSYLVDIEGPKESVSRFRQMFRDVYWKAWDGFNLEEDMDKEKEKRKKLQDEDCCYIEFDTKKYIDFSNLLLLMKEFPDIHFGITIDGNDMFMGFNLFNSEFEFILDNSDDENEDAEDEDDNDAEDEDIEKNDENTSFQNNNIGIPVPIFLSFMVFLVIITAGAFLILSKT